MEGDLPVLVQNLTSSIYIIGRPLLRSAGVSLAYSILRLGVGW